jgi:sulfur carrier protein
MNITVNGATAAVPDRCTVRDLLADRRVAPDGTAVAVNGEVVPRSALDRHLLARGDVVELVTAVQGG